MEAAESLFKCLEQVPDAKKARGVRRPVRAIPRLTLLGLVCGQTTMAHIAIFARMNWSALEEPLGFLRDHSPHASTISRILAGVPYELLQGAENIPLVIEMAMEPFGAQGPMWGSDYPHVAKREGYGNSLRVTIAGIGPWWRVR